MGLKKAQAKKYAESVQHMKTVKPFDSMLTQRGQTEQLQVRKILVIEMDNLSNEVEASVAEADFCC